MSITTDVIGEITDHHLELQTTLTSRVNDVIVAAHTNQPHGLAVAQLTQFLAHDIVPHARAEEDVLYAAAVSNELRLLVSGMRFEHETLLALATELSKANSAVDAAGIARAILEIFTGHVRRENELLLPALGDDPNTDLVALMPLMEERFSLHQDPKTLPIAGSRITGPDHRLDVRNEAPMTRHQLIFQTYEATPIGEAFILINDHDPKPLYYQFEAEEKGRFSWDYLESGPEVWRVRIGHTSN